MKHSFPTFSACGALLLTSLVAAIPGHASSGWHRADGRSAQKPAEFKRQATPQSQYLNRLGISAPYSKLRPAVTGEARTPQRVVNAIPDATRERGIHRSPQAPRGNIYAVVNRFNGIQMTGEAYVGRLDLTSGYISPLHVGPVYSPYADNDYTLQANAYRQGEIICPSVTMTDTYAVTWDFMDFETGEYLRTLDFGADMMANPYTMTYNAKDDLFYLICIDGETDGQFSIVDPKKDYEVEYVGNLRRKGGFIASIAYNEADDRIYVFNDNNDVFTLDPSTGNLVEAGYIELPTGDYLFTEGMAGQITYSPADQMFVCVYRDNAMQASRILFIHPETFEVFEGEVVSADRTPYVTAIFCTDDFATPDAPELAPMPVISFDAPALSGKIELTAPKFTYAGVAIGSATMRATLLIDGKSYYEAVVTPGQQITLPDVTLSQGEHHLEFYTSIGNDRSPVRAVDFYTGYDNPCPPASLLLDGNLLSWTAPKGPGLHEGYVDYSDLTYDVYIGSKQQNASPLTSTSFTLTPPESIDRYEISVVAVSKGLESERATLTSVFGAPFTLPFSQLPSRSETRYYTVEDSNGDERSWFYADSGNGLEAEEGSLQYGWCFVTGYTTPADDWLFLPPVEITDPAQLYTFSYDIAGIYSFPTIESFDVVVGRSPSAAAMRNGTCIFTTSSKEMTFATEHMSHDFGVAEPGSYVIGIRFKGSPSTDSQGLVVANLDLRNAAGKSSAIPGDPTGVSLIPAERGGKSVTASMTLPTVDLSGKALPTDKQISMTLSDGETSVTTQGLPGAPLSMTLDVETSGRKYLTLTPSNEIGSGYPRVYPAYVGIDRPLAPVGLQTIPSDDNLSLYLKWDAPSTTGENGAYVNSDDLSYNIYVRSDSNSALRVGQTKEKEFSYSPFSGSVPALTHYSVGVTAYNEAGESYNTVYTIENLGRPYELPMLEEWGEQMFDYVSYSFLTTGDYASTQWQNAGSMYGAGVGDPEFVQGGLVAYSILGSGKGKAKLILPKASTSGVAKANFILRYWDYPQAPDIRIYGRRSGATEEQLLGTFRMQHPQGGKWVDGVIPFPADFMQQGWIEVRVETEFPGASDLEYLVLDSFQFFPDADKDLKVTSLSGPNQTAIGETLLCEATVANSGRDNMEGTFRIELTDSKGNIYASTSADVPSLRSNESFMLDAEFEIDGAFRDVEDLKCVATIDCRNDENMANNIREFPIEILGSQTPVVNDLKGSVGESGVNLSWSVPPTSYGDFESFEAIEPFGISESLGMWQNYDLDGLDPINLANNATGATLRWDGSDQPQGWTVVNVEEIGYMAEPRIAPHSGKCVLMARSGYYDPESDPMQSSKWLVSPEVVGGTELSFWMSTLAPDITEYIEIWYSETDAKLDPATATSTRNGSFRRARTFNKNGTETWELIQCTLPASAKYFAIRYTSYDGAAVVLDDISFTPANMLEHTITGYSLYRSDNGSPYRRVQRNLTSTTFTDIDWNDQKTNYYVTVAVDLYGRTVEGPRSNIVNVNGSSVDLIGAGSSITSREGYILLSGLEGYDYTVTTPSGLTIAKGTARTESTAIAVEPGIYIVSVGNLTAKLSLTPRN